MSSNKDPSGWFFGIGAFVWWGLVPIYFKAVATVPAEEILAHRIAWSVPVTLLFMLLLRKRVLITQILADRKLLLGLTASTALVSCNWYVFTWAVTHERILATSLGYFINPIMSILMGVILLGEKLTRMQWMAVAAVSLGVINQIVNFGEVPWIALSLATSFALYGFIRKQLAVDSLNGLLLETSIALPFAGGYIVWSLFNQSAFFLDQTVELDLLLMSGGVITAVPLIWFAQAARTIPLNSVGFLQFIAPSLTFLLATQVYDEALGGKQLLSFAFIWVGLALYLLKPLSLLLKRPKQIE